MCRYNYVAISILEWGSGIWGCWFFEGRPGSQRSSQISHFPSSYERNVSFFSRCFLGVLFYWGAIFWGASFPGFAVPVRYSFRWGLAFTGPSTWARRRIWAPSLHAVSTSAFGWGSGHPPISNKGSKDILLLPCPLSSSPTQTTNWGPQLISDSSWLPV